MARAMINLGPELETSHLSEAKTINVFAAFLYIANFRGMSFRELKKQFATDSCEFFLSDAKAIREWTKSCKAQGVEAKSEVGFEGTSESFYALKTAFEELKNYRDYVVKKRTKGIQVEIAGTSEILGSIYVAFDKIKKTLKSIDAVDVDDAYQFDFHAFVRSHGTIYLDVARGSEPNPLVGAFLKEAMHQWSHASSIPHWSRTETLLVVLDETLELAPITNLPDRIGSLYKDAIQMITVLHSGFHAQQMWGSSVGTFFQNMSNHVFLPGYLDSGYFAKNKDMLVKSGVEESTKHGFFNPETGSAHILTFDNGAKIRDVTNPDIGQIVDKATIDLQLGL